MNNEERNTNSNENESLDNNLSVSISNADIRLIVNLIDAVADRGAIRGEEMLVVGDLRNRLAENIS